jgi:transcriptional regulator with XRE-family HTH domain
MHIGNRIRQEQRARDISCVQLADALGVLPQQLSRWRNAEDLKISIVIKIANVFGMTVDEFIGQKEGTE